LGGKNIKTSIYLSKINVALSKEQINFLLGFISKENREKCRNSRFKKDKLRTLYGELMVRYILCKKLLLENKDIELLKSETGKPYVKNCSIHFNISHSGDFVVCVFSDQEIGIDIEQMKEVNLKVAKRFFCQCEYQDLLDKKGSDQNCYFYSLWTLKESYIKWLGTGLLTSLNTFCFSERDCDLCFADKKMEIKPFFKTFYIENCKLSVCSMNYIFPNNVKRICIEKIFLI